MRQPALRRVADPPRPKPSKAPATSTRKAPASLKPFPPTVAVPTAGEPSKKEGHGEPHLHQVHTPFIPATTILPEVTVKAVVLGVILAVLLGAANTYLGLKAGLTVAASIPAAVMSLAVLRLFRKHNILENNMVQTIASAGTSVASGAIFTIPALLLLGYWERLHYWETTFIVIVGGLLGVLFSVPIRRALIVEENLPFPEGRATGEVLKAGAKGGAGVGALVMGAVSGAVYKIIGGGFKVWPEERPTTLALGGNTVMGVGVNLSAALAGVGFIIGLRIAVLVFLGGVLGWIVGIPLYSTFAADLFDASVGPIKEGQQVSIFDRRGAEGLATSIWAERIRYVGVGAMLVGGMWSLVKLRKPLGRAIMQGVRSARSGAATDVPRTERDLPFKAVGLGVIALSVPMAIFYAWVTGNIGMGIALAGIMLVTGFAFSAVGGYMAGLVGSSNTPISGVTILALLASCFALLAMGVTSSIGPPAAIMVAAIIAVAGSIAGDNLQDLKAGHMLGATPRKQQLLLMVGAVASAFVIAPVIQILVDGAENRGPDTPLGDINAPQANLMYALSNAIFSPDGLFPMQQLMMLVGGLLAVALILTDKALKAAGSSWGTPVMPVAVGIYLPVGLSVPIFVGGLVAWFADLWYERRARGQSNPIAAGWKWLGEAGNRAGVLFASGLIAGEAILGIATAFMAAQGVSLGLEFHERHDWAGILVLAYMLFLAYYVAIRPGLRQRSTGTDPPPPEGPLVPRAGH
jgi:putative OPT family oligopeptide transporter